MAIYSGLGAIPLPKILDRWAANTGRSEGATAEKAVPFPGAVRRSQSFLRSLRSTHFTGRIAMTHEMLERKKSRDQILPNFAASNGPEKQELLRLIGTLVRGPDATRS